MLRKLGAFSLFYIRTNLYLVAKSLRCYIDRIFRKTNHARVSTMIIQAVGME